MRIVHKALGFGLLIGLAACVLQAGTPRSIQLATRPLAFEENRGQTDGRVRFLSRGDGYSLFLTPMEAVLALRQDGPAQVLRLRWEGAAPAPRVSGEEELPGKSHYLVGNDPAKWQRGIPSYQKVQYREIYPGIDLAFYGNPRELEYDFILAPGADPKSVRLAIDGADRMEIDPTGDLVLHLGSGEIRLKRPVSYQETGGVRREVASAFRRTGDGRIGFAVGAYDPGRPLVIDPVLVYSTYLGGSDDLDEGSGIAADAAGNAYVTGITRSPDFPATTGSRFTNLGEDAFVTKLDPGGALVFSLYLGGSSTDGGSDIALDLAGNLYVTGITFSADFPRVHPVQASPAVGGDAFVAKLDSSGAVLLYSTNLGGSGRDAASRIAVDPQGNAYAAGVTSSLDFPQVNAPPLPSNPARTIGDAFAAKIAPGGSLLLYSVPFGGTGEDVALGIAVDAAGQAHLTGTTRSTDFPTANALQGSYGGGEFDAFVTKLSPSGSQLVYSTYLGGASRDVGFAIAERGGSAYVTGDTASTDFPKLGALQPVLHGGFDVFVARLSPAGSLTYATYLGGSGVEQAQGIALDGAGNIYLAGPTLSADFPLRDPVQASCEPSQGAFCTGDAFVTKINPQGSALVYSTFLGGAVSTFPLFESFDTGSDIAVDIQGAAYVTGYNHSLDFPTVNAFQPAHGGGGRDGFVAKIVDNQSPVCSAAFASPAMLWPPNGKLISIAIRGVTDPDGDPVTVTITGVRQDEPLSKPGMPDALGIGTSAVQLRADRAGGGDGRVYRVTFEASDGKGGVCTGTVTVCVPRDQGQGRTCGDGGPLFPSGS